MATRRLLVVVAGDARSLEKTLGRASAQTTAFSASVTRSFTSVAKSVGLIGAGVGAAGIALGLKNAVTAAANFEQTMQKVVGLSGVAQGAIGGLTDDILKLAPAVGKGPQELAEGLQFITSSGVAAADAMGVLKVSAQAAAAGLGETKTVADAVTSVMNAYGPAVVNAQKATDVLVATVREGKGEADEFAGVIGNVVSIASQLGVSFEDVGAALAAMTRLGTDAQTAATQLQSVFSNLTKVTPQQEKAFEKVGLSAKGLREELQNQGLLATLKTIKTAFAGDIPGLSKAFGDVRALRGVLALVGTQFGEVNGIFERLQRSAGSTQKAFNAISDTTFQKFQRLNAAVDTARITIGAAFAPAAERAASAVANWLSKTENQEKIQRAAEKGARVLERTVLAVADAFKTLRDTLSPVVDLMGGLENAIRLLVGVLVAKKITDFLVPIRLLGTASKTSAAQVGVLRTALTRLGALGIITVGVEILINHDKITNEFNKLTDKGIGPIKTPTVDLSKLDLKGLEKFRHDIQGLGGDNDKLVAAVDRAIKKLLDLQQAANGGLTAAGKIEAGRPKTPDTGASFAKAVADALNVAQGAVGSALDSAQKAINQNRTRTANAANAARKAATEQRKHFDAILEAIGLKVDKAAATKGFQDDLKRNTELQKAIRAQIAVEGHTTELEQKLFQARQARATIVSDRATAATAAQEKATAKIQASQFKALGLTGEGDARTPGVANLRRQLTQLTNRLGPEVAPKVQSQIERIGKVLSGAFGKVSLETRQKIVELFDTIRGTIDSETQKTGPKTATRNLLSSLKITDLGLDVPNLLKLQGRVSQFNTAGVALGAPAANVQRPFQATAPIEVHTEIRLDGDVIGRAITRHQQRHRPAAQTRGRFAGIGHGLG